MSRFLSSVNDYSLIYTYVHNVLYLHIRGMSEREKSVT